MRATSDMVRLVTLWRWDRAIARDGDVLYLGSSWRQKAFPTNRVSILHAGIKER